MSWPLVKIKDIFDVARGGSPRPIQDYITDDPDGLNWVMIGDTVKGSKYIETTAKKIRKEGLKKTRQVKPGDFLLTNSMSFGRPYIMKTSGCVHDGWLILSPKSDQIYTDYFFHYLGSEEVYNRLASKAAGAVVKNLNKDVVKELEIPLPPLPEQKRIAAILDKADQLRQKRQQAIGLADEFLRSVFLDMFGDPVINPKRFELRKLSELYATPKTGTKCGPFGSALKKDEYQSEGVPVWNMDNISLQGQFIDGPNLWITEDKFQDLEQYSIEAGDIIISRAGTVGKMGVVRSKHPCSVISTNLIRVRFGAELIPEFFISLMIFCKGRIGNLKTGPDGTFTHMNTGILDKLVFPYPPLDIQHKYISVYNRVNKFKSQLIAGQDVTGEMFNSLSQKSFVGEL